MSFSGYPLVVLVAEVIGSFKVVPNNFLFHCTSTLHQNSSCGTLLNSVTRGSFGWSKTTPARSFATFGPNFLKIVDAGRKRHGTSLPAPRGEGCFFFRAPLLLHKGPGKPAGLRNGYLLRRGAFATPALKRHRSTNLDTGPEDGLDSSTAPEGRW
jgi:hypothetical protein